MHDRLHRLIAWLDAPEDLASLAVFRMVFGALLVWEGVGALTSGRPEYYAQLAARFTYPGLSWLPMPSLTGLYALWLVQITCALLVIAGWRTRFALGGLGLALLYIFSLDRTDYLNHAYLILLLCGVLATGPCGRAWSLDARRLEHPPVGPRRGRVTLLALLGIVYTHAGLAKLNADWLTGRPLVAWLNARHLPLGALDVHEAGVFMAWCGAAFDLTVIPLLLWRRTRWLAVIASLLFHLTNARLFHIGVFPWLMLGALALVFEPGWPRRLLARAQPTQHTPQPSPHARTAAALTAAFLLFQLLWPLRHHLIADDVAWDEAGHMLSWRMKLRSKRGWAVFWVTPPGGDPLMADLPASLSPSQQHHLPCYPDMIWAHAARLARAYSRDGRLATVHLDGACSLNGHPERPMVAPDLDLATAAPPVWWRRAEWVLGPHPRLTSR